MEKIYVLLQNNQQTGPYSLSEIIQFDLTPYDLIWIEGKSAGWYYPQEIAALQPYLKFLPKASQPEKTPLPQPVFVSLPAERRTAAAEPTVVPEKPAVVQESVAAKPVTDNLEKQVYAQFFTPAGEKSPFPETPVQRKKSPNQAGVAVVSVLVVAGVFAASWIMNKGTQEESDQTTALASHTSTPEEILPPSVAGQNPAFPSTRNNSQQRVQKNSVVRKQNAEPRQQIVIVERTIEAGDTEPESSEYETATSPAVNEPANSEEAAATPTENTAPSEKKKKLRDKIGDIFRKNPAENKTEGAKPASEERGERRPVYREGAATLSQLVHVRFTIPNDWMMGISGAKATLVNRSNETINRATIEVSYFDDENQLLQKKTITFGKIDGKGTQTLAVPDHPSATKLDYSVVSVIGRPAA